MTLPERIASALKEPIDKESMMQAEISVRAMHGNDMVKLLYTLLRERKALLAQVDELGKKFVEKSTRNFELCWDVEALKKQVEAERWRDAEKEKPEVQIHILLLVGKHAAVGFFCKNGSYYDAYNQIELKPAHWKPINLPTV